MGCAEILPIKEAKKCEHLSRISVGIDGKFHVKRDACRRNVDGKVIVFLSSVVNYFGDLQILANVTFVWHIHSL